MSQWYLVRLELAPTKDFPRGSPSRAFLFRLPLTENGQIDNAELEANPKAVFVRRYWSDEADSHGTVRPNASGWNLIYDGEEEIRKGHLDLAPMVIDGIAEIAGADGIPLPFRVVSVRPE